ncbi:hypothetical protein Anapl_16983 [Anas platyrhynchos]|uniref:Uncharacterized protein n=1 Tax=Anas platyrhynchos TaxID=8839 RepID=R0L5L5_ANAPL|nr:hypothetical protein Anapl_16983 [Anas platyrhynchos]
MMSKSHCSATKSWNGNWNKWVGREKSISISRASRRALAGKRRKEERQRRCKNNQEKLTWDPVRVGQGELQALDHTYAPLVARPTKMHKGSFIGGTRKAVVPSLTLRMRIHKAAFPRGEKTAPHQSSKKPVPAMQETQHCEDLNAAVSSWSYV